MKKYILKKVYPKSPNLGTIITQMGWGETYDCAGDFPEFWQEVKQYPLICELYDLGTKYAIDVNDRFDNVDFDEKKYGIEKIKISENDVLSINDLTNFGKIHNFSYIKSLNEFWVECLVPQGQNIVEISKVQKLIIPEKIEKEPTFEILSIVDNHGNIVYVFSAAKKPIKEMNSLYIDRINSIKSTYRINSVKRLSDNKIFKLNDIVKYFSVSLYKDFIMQIKHFNIDDNGEIKILHEEKGFTFVQLSLISPVKFLFKTADNVDIREDLTYKIFIVDKNNNLLTDVICNRIPDDKDNKYFIDKKQAEKYIDERKPKYSNLEMGELLSSILLNWTGRDVDKEKIIDQFIHNLQSFKK